MKPQNVFKTRKSKNSDKSERNRKQGNISRLCSWIFIWLCNENLIWVVFTETPPGLALREKEKDTTQLQTGQKRTTYKYHITTGKFVGIYILSTSWVTVKNTYLNVVHILTEGLFHSLNFGKFWQVTLDPLF